MEIPIPQYCTPEEVADTLDLPDLNDNYGRTGFSDLSHPSYNQVCRMIAANEDEIDRRVRRTWRENYVVRQQLSIQDYWADINGWRADYYQNGGHYIQLRKNIRPWDPNPIYGEEPREIMVESVEGLEVGGDIKTKTAEGRIEDIDYTPQYNEQTGKEEYRVTILPMLYPGDKLEIRNRNNVWQDISDSISDLVSEGSDINSGGTRDVTNSYIDYAYGKIYIRTRLYQNKANAVRVTYRYGQEPQEIPAGIARACCLMTAIDVLTMSPFYIKVGQSGDINGAYDRVIRGWQDKINAQLSAFQRAGTVHAMW